MAHITIKANNERLLPLRDSEDSVIGEVKITEEIIIGKIESWELSDPRKFPKSKVDVKREVFKRK